MEDNIKQLSAYFKENLAKGILEADLKKASLSQGWSEIDINKALDLAKNDIPVPPTPNPTIPNIPITPTNQNPQPQQLLNSNFIDSLVKNPKFVETVKIVTIYTTIFYVINYLVNSVSGSIFLVKYYSSFKLTIPFAGLIQSTILAIIGGALGGILLYFFYEPIKNFVKGSSFLSKHMHSMFTLIWKPTLTFTLIAFVLALLPILATIFISPKLFLNIVITSVAQLVLCYIYAKKLAEKLEKYYPW